MTTIEGFVEKGFEPVFSAFKSNFDNNDEIGAAVSIFIESKCVVDLWGGIADTRSNKPWTKDSLQLVFSSTKGATSILANILIQEKILEIDKPVCYYWPEFGENGKDEITVEELLTHKAGLPYIEESFELDDVVAWHPITQALARQNPIWKPGTEHGYHAITFGWLVGELIRRALNEVSFRSCFEKLVSKPLGIDFYIGLPEELSDRVTHLKTIGRPEDEEMAKIYDAFVGPDTLTGKALMSPSPALKDMEIWNNQTIYKAEIPSANGITDARSLAKMYASCVSTVEGQRLLSDEQLKLATQVRTSGADKVLYFETKFGLGFMLPSLNSLYAGENAFGHDGAGGSHGWADSKHKVGFGYVMNKMIASLNGDPRSHALTNALYRSIGEKEPFS